VEFKYVLGDDFISLLQRCLENSESISHFSSLTNKNIQNSSTDLSAELKDGIIFQSFHNLVVYFHLDHNPSQTLNTKKRLEGKNYKVHPERIRELCVCVCVSVCVCECV
jgi:hypothetical protein